MARTAGFSGIDLTYIESAMPGRVGAGAYAARLEESLKKQAGDAGQRLREQFEAECQEEGVPSEFLSFEGDPIEALSSAAETHDLLISGHDTAFRGNVRELSEVLSRFLLVTPRPMIVCPDELSPVGDILVAYDGSFAAVRAVQMFALFGVVHDRLIQIVSIDSDAGLASQRAGRAAKYVRTHGYQVNEIPIASSARPAQALRSEIANRRIRTAIMGAYGHRGLRERLFGSTTSALVENPPCALFLYH
ncbi:MAG: universal stress protein [Burkholderiales bacterium]